MAKFKRKRFFIDKQLQTKYVILTLLLLLIYTVILTAVLISPYVIPLSVGTPLSSAGPTPQQAEAARMLLTMHQNIWPILGALILAMSALSIFVTHKIAGPVYRFKKVLAEVAAGNLDITVKLRDKDDLQDLAGDFNLLIAELQSFVATLRNDHATLSLCIDELEGQIEKHHTSNEAGQALLVQLKTSKEGIAKTLEKYSKPA